ncbi:MAG: GMC family oxidoreductase N-terminal domain-containing protein [Solirubrobacterales bacterium]
MYQSSFDYVIVGGGTAGSVIARRLADAGTGTVCLLEAGPSDESDQRVLQLRDWMGVPGTELNREYELEPQERGNSRLRHTRAIVLGGCSSHNAAIAFKPLESDLEAWVAAGADGWDPASVAPAWERLRERVRIEEAPDVNPLSRAFVEAGVEAGLPRTRFNLDPHGEGVGWLALNQHGGVRQSSSVAYLHPVAELPATLELRTGTSVKRVLIEDGRARGVETEGGRIEARREVLLCAGAFESPKLLALSGVGDGEELRALGIPVAHHLPGVGRHLLDHPEGTVMWESTRPIPAESSQFWDVACFAKSDPALARPDLMIHFGITPGDVKGALAGYPVTEHVFCLTPNVMYPRSHGTLKLRSADPEDRPAIDFRYFTDPEGYDLRMMVAGLRLCRTIAAVPALAPWRGRELAPGPAVESEEALAAFVERTHTTVSHPAGTCRMGAADDATAVVDPALRVRGVAGLRVADASVFPEITGVNPCLTCMLVGERCAELVQSEAAAPA